MNSNSMLLLHPYLKQGSWVFDDPQVDLVAEPFVLGIDTMIDRLVAEIPNAGSGFKLLFSAQPFPGCAAELQWRRAESGGNWYYSPTYDLEGWLCPALYKYFKSAPERLFAKAEPLPSAAAQ